MFQAGAIYEGQYFLGTSIARPLIAKRMVEIAGAEDAEAISHGATGKGNDQVRFELTAAALAPHLRVIAPWREESFRNQFPGRSEMIAFAEANGIPITASATKPYSTDRNLLHISYESGVLENPWVDASAPEMREMYKLTVAPQDAPDRAELIDLTFERGDCVCVSPANGGAGVREHRAGDIAENKVMMSPLTVMQILNQVGGRHGIGRVDMVENQYVGMKSRGVYETPGGAILHFAHRQMEGLTLDRELMHLRDSLIPKYSELVYDGYWFSPERQALQALVSETQRSVTGVVRLRLYKGNIIVAGRKSDRSLYDASIATMEGDASQYNQSDATGFIRINALRLKLRAALDDDK
jgi:argininosuccinate synthase